MATLLPSAEMGGDTKKNGRPPFRDQTQRRAAQDCFEQQIGIVP
jgi:hypothetical protein